jgi:hypothetical protein
MTDAGPPEIYYYASSYGSPLLSLLHSFFLLPLRLVPYGSV